MSSEHRREHRDQRIRLGTRYALRAGVSRADRARNGNTPVALTPAEAVDWIAELAAEPAVRFVGGTRRVQNGHRAIRAVLIGRPLCIADVRDVGFMLALAAREAGLYGPAGRKVVETTALAVDGVAVIDIRLPMMNGRDLARRLREVGTDAKLIALSGYARREDEEASLASGFDIHLVKPVRADVLERHLRGIVHPVRARPALLRERVSVIARHDGSPRPESVKDPRGVPPT